MGTRSKRNGKVINYGFGLRGKRPELPADQLKALAIIRLNDIGLKIPKIKTGDCIEYLIKHK